MTEQSSSSPIDTRKAVIQSTERLYRYKNNEQGEIYLVEFIPFARTRCGWWIVDNYSAPRKKRGLSRFVLAPCGDDARYAYPTKDAAMLSFKIRKSRQLERLARETERVHKALKNATNMRFAYEIEATFSEII